MEEELKILIKVWVCAIISISYCYYLPSKIKYGVPRLIFISPVLVLFLALPMFFSAVYLSLTTAFFLTWLANFKLVLFAFDKGPLIPIPSNLPQFFCFSCFPIKAQQNPKPQNHLPLLVFTIKIVIYFVLLHLYSFRQNMSQTLQLGLFFVHVYLDIEIILTFIRVVVCVFLRCDLEPQSNKPYLATSLQDFWDRRWNVMVPAILREAVYAPMRGVSKRQMSSTLALVPGIFAAFFVSGLIHELLIFYLTREMPTWGITLFFVLHGICTAVELTLKKKKTTVMQRWRLSPSVSRLLTVGFVFVTCGWLVAPQLIKSGVIERYTYEALLFVDFVKDKFFTLFGIFNIKKN